MGFMTDTFIQQILLSSYYVPIILLDTRRTVGSKAKSLPFCGLYSSREDKVMNTA